ILVRAVLNGEHDRFGRLYEIYAPLVHGVFFIARHARQQNSVHQRRVYLVYFGRLYEIYAPLVHGVLLARVPRDEVDDLVQDIFLHALKKLHTLRNPMAIGPWIAMIARNRAMDFHRASRNTVEVDEQTAVAKPLNR